MFLPSVKKLSTITDQPKLLRQVLAAETKAELATIMADNRNVFAATENWIAKCYHEPNFHDIKMNMADCLCKTYGVEYIKHGQGAKSPAIEYLNAGDTYTTTLLFIRGTYRVGNWGDIVEAGNYE